MKRKNTKFLVIILVSFVLVLAGVYALLATTLNIAGTATGQADFKIEFNSATVTDPAKATATIASSGTALNITSNLSYPGDTVTINFIIKNTGSLAAKVDNLTITNNSNPDLIAQINGLTNIKGTTLAVGATTTGSVVVTWSTASTIQNPADVNFTVTLDYSQATT